MCSLCRTRTRLKKGRLSYRFLHNCTSRSLKFASQAATDTRERRFCAPEARRAPSATRSRLTREAESQRAAQPAHLSQAHGHLRERLRRDALSDVMRLAAADDDDRRGVRQARDSAHMRSDAKCRCEPSSCIAAARSERSAWPAAASGARSRRLVWVRCKADYYLKK